MNRVDLSTIYKALSRIIMVMRHPAIAVQRGKTWTAEEASLIQLGPVYLEEIDRNPQTMVCRLENEKMLARVGEVLELGVMMLHREGFKAAKGEAWDERDRQVIEAGLKAFDKTTAYQRG